MALREFIPGYNYDPYENLVNGLQEVLGDGDALALLPYDDGTFYLKRAYFDKNLIGGMGGYETEDGDKIAVDGNGTAKRDLFGVPMILGVDPTEHAAAVDPIKALIAHKRDIGEWLRLDRRGQVVQAGPALEPAPVIVEYEDVEAAMDDAPLDELLALVIEGYDPEEYSDEEAAALFEEHYGEIEEAVELVLEREATPEVSPEGMVGDGGMVGEYIQQQQQEGRQVSFKQALAELAEVGDVQRVYDIAPPAGVEMDADGEVSVVEATHVAVDQSKAADLLPTTWDTVELNTALDKARMEEYEEGKLMKYMIYGIIIGVVGALVITVFMFLMFQLGGGVF